MQGILPPRLAQQDDDDLLDVAIGLMVRAHRRGDEFVEALAASAIAKLEARREGVQS
jgi:hypothetical protein